MSFRVGEIIDIPSPIDVHTHLREPGGEEKETIETGTLAALRGGYQAVFDMPNNPGGNETRSTDRLEEKMAIARRTAHTRIGFYAGVNLDNPDFGQIRPMIRMSAGTKFYMGHTTGNLKTYTLDNAREYIDDHIRAAREYGQFPPLLLHARHEIGKETAEYIARQQYPVHWCHIADEHEIRMVRDLNGRYSEWFTAGITPHHFTMTSMAADFQYGWNARMQPPLGGDVDHDAIVRAFNDSELHIIETDHAPHTEEQKLESERENPQGNTDPDCVTCFGISGIEFALPILMSLVQRGIIPMERLVDGLYTQPARMLRLDTSKDSSRTYLEIGPWRIGEKDKVGKSSNHPYFGWMAWAKVVEVSLDVNENDKILKTGSIL
jgi:dihydroorotase